MEGELVCLLIYKWLFNFNRFNFCLCVCMLYFFIDFDFEEKDLSYGLDEDLDVVFGMKCCGLWIIIKVK